MAHVVLGTAIQEKASTNRSEFSGELLRREVWSPRLGGEAGGAGLVQAGRVPCKGAQQQQPSVCNEVRKKTSVRLFRERCSRRLGGSKRLKQEVQSRYKEKARCDEDSW